MTAPAPVSTVPAVKGYLFDQLTAALASDPLRPGVFYDEPGTNLPDDIVVVGQCHTRTVSPLAMVGSGGAGARWETYTIEVTVSCFRGGDNARAVFERAYGLASRVEDVVRADPSLGGLVNSAWPKGSHDDPTNESNHKGRLCAVVLEIEIGAPL